MLMYFDLPAQPSPSTGGSRSSYWAPLLYSMSVCDVLMNQNNQYECVWVCVCTVEEATSLSFRIPGSVSFCQTLLWCKFSGQSWYCSTFRKHAFSGTNV